MPPCVGLRYREVFGVVLSQKRNDVIFSAEHLKNVVTKVRRVVPHHGHVPCSESCTSGQQCTALAPCGTLRASAAAALPAAAPDRFALDSVVRSYITPGRVRLRGHGRGVRAAGCVVAGPLVTSVTAG